MRQLLRSQHRRFGSIINRLRSAVFEVLLVLSLFLRCTANLRGMRIFSYTQTQPGAYLRSSSRVPRRRPFIYLKPPYAIGSVPSSSGDATAYRWCSLPRVRRHKASKPQGSSERVLPWQVTIDQSICASCSHTHYWYEVGMSKVY